MDLSEDVTRVTLRVNKNITVNSFLLCLKDSVCVKTD